MIEKCVAFFYLREFFKLSALTARGWLWSSNVLQKWKAEAICDRSCIPLFSLGWSERKVRAFWIGQRKILRSKNVIDFFSLKIQWKRKILRLKIFDIFSDRKFSIFSTGFSMKNYRWQFLFECNTTVMTTVRRFDIVLFLFNESFWLKKVWVFCPWSVCIG